MWAEGRASADRAGIARFIAARYDRRSLVALALLISAGAAVGYRWSDLIDIDGGMDWLLGGIWAAMALLVTWNVRPRRDLTMLAVGLAGGTAIEWWGTTTGLWAYFTGERPPLWILPAWPLAALSIDRLATLLGRGASSLFSLRERHLRVVVVFALSAFSLSMLAFVRPAAHYLTTLAVIALMAGVASRSRCPRQDLAMFAAGSLLGLFLEYWGTSRQCWTYYTGQVPPAVVVFAHGFAEVVFARAVAVVESAFERLRPRAEHVGARVS